jgi:hypothetical protein
MAKAPAADSIMAPDKMKPLLALSKREPVHAAIALSGDGDAIILLDKKAKPRQVASLLRAGAGKAKIALNAATVRYGRAEVDTDYDPGMVRFFLNKEAPGSMRPKLVEVVKRISFQKVELNVDPAIDAAEDGTAAGSDDAMSTTDAPDVASATPSAQGAATPSDAASLTHELAELIGQIAAVAGNDAARKAALAKLAGEANTALKAGDAGPAAEHMAKLRQALHPATTRTDDTSAGVAAELRERLTICVTDMRALRNPAAMAPLAKSAQEIGALLHDGKIGPAASLIDVLESRIAEAMRAARQTTVGADAGHVVEFAKLLLRWREAQQRFDSNLRAVGEALLARPEIQADPRKDIVRQAVDAFPNLVPKFGGALEDALNAGINASEPADKARLATQSAGAVDAYRQQLNAAKELLELERFASSDLGTSLRLPGELDETLAELRQLLTA